MTPTPLQRPAPSALAAKHPTEKPARLIKAICASLLLCSAQWAHADAADDNIAKACGGLSQFFYNQSKIPGPDDIDKEVLQGMLMPGNAVLVNRAKITGAAHACGEQTDTAWKAIQAQAASTFPSATARSQRFTQVIDCTEARFEQIGLAGNWAVASKDACPRARRDYLFYVRDGHPFSDKPPAGQDK